jgi:hypothetical protein
MDVWYTGHQQAHHSRAELIGGRLLDSYELPIRAERLRQALVAAQLGAVREPHEHGLAPIPAVHTAAVVSPGVDTFEHAPISSFKLRCGDDLELGCRLRRLAVPALFVLEGGCATDEVGANAAAVPLGFERD